MSAATEAQVDLSSPPEATPAGPQNGTRRAFQLLFWLPVVLTCFWVLSLPVFPSQDGPLHLYYVNVLRQLLAHQPGVYADTYRVKSLVTPYSVYYYGLLTLNRVVSLEMADKLIVCVYLLLFAASTRTLLRAVSGDSTLSSFLCLPVLLNWPLLMGFINYSLSTCLAFLALAAWCAGIRQTRTWTRAAFLLLICLMMVTHPVPWMIVVSFAFLELAIRLLRSRTNGTTAAAQFGSRAFRIDLATAVLACVPYLYLHGFSRVVQTLEPPNPHPRPNALLAHLLPHAALVFADRALSFLYTFGIDVFTGGTALLRLYRGGIALLLLGMILAGLWSVLRSGGEGRWTLSNTWLVFSLLLLPFLLFLPDPLQDRYFFAARMGILFFVGAAASAATLLRQRQRLGMAVAAACLLFSFLTLALAVRYITPAAEALDSVRLAPRVDGTLPGLSMLPPGAGATPGLNFIPYNWGTARYYRQNNLVIYNTAWLGDPIILVGVRPELLPQLDSSYFESVPWYGSRLLGNEAAMKAAMDRVGFVMLMRQNAPLTEHPLAEKPGQQQPGPYASGWSCTHSETQQWYLCQGDEKERTR